MKSWCCDVAGCGQVMRRQVDVFEIHTEWQEPTGDPAEGKTRMRKADLDLCPDCRALFEAWLRGEATIIMDSATTEGEEKAS